MGVLNTVRGKATGASKDRSAPWRTGATRRRRFVTGVVGVAVLAALQVPVPATPAGAAPAAPVEVPALPSSPAPTPAPTLAVGDFANPPPPPSQRSSQPPSPRSSSFDPRRSTPLDDLTTPTRRLYANPDGSTTAVVSAAPVRQRTAQGTWRDLDLSLTAGAGGALGARFAPSAARLSGRVGPGADTASVDTPAGTIVLRHPTPRQGRRWWRATPPVSGPPCPPGAT